jgi:hypothetical protein
MQDNISSSQDKLSQKKERDSLSWLDEISDLMRWLSWLDKINYVTQKLCGWQKYATIPSTKLFYSKHLNKKAVQCKMFAGALEILTSIDPIKIICHK